MAGMSNPFENLGRGQLDQYVKGHNAGMALTELEIKAAGCPQVIEGSFMDAIAQAGEAQDKLDALQNPLVEMVTDKMPNLFG